MASVKPISIKLKNNTHSNTVFAYITGQDIDNNNWLVFLQANGTDLYHPKNPGSTTSPLAVDCVIPLNGVGQDPKIVKLPIHIGSGRIYFSVDAPLDFQLSSGPTLIEPSVSNTADPNYSINWDFCELTYDSTQLFVNISFVDFVGFPISLGTKSTDGATQSVVGLPADGLTKNQLIINHHGKDLRAISPNIGITMSPNLFKGYYEGWVSQVWDKYKSEALIVDTGDQIGIVNGQVNSNDKLQFPSNVTFSKPSTADIFSNSTGPFANQSGTDLSALVPILAAAFERSTLLNDTKTPDSIDQYYPDNAPMNHYSRIIHANSKDGRGYAFPFDDVKPSDGSDQSGSITETKPAELTVTVGGIQ